MGSDHHNRSWSRLSLVNACKMSHFYREQISSSREVTRLLSQTRPSFLTQSKVFSCAFEQQTRLALQLHRSTQFLCACREQKVKSLNPCFDQWILLCKDWGFEKPAAGIPKSYFPPSRAFVPFVPVVQMLSRSVRVRPPFNFVHEWMQRICAKRMFFHSMWILCTILQLLDST